MTNDLCSSRLCQTGNYTLGSCTNSRKISKYHTCMPRVRIDKLIFSVNLMYLNVVYSWSCKDCNRLWSVKQQIKKYSCYILKGLLLLWITAYHKDFTLDLFCCALLWSVRGHFCQVLVVYSLTLRQCYNLTTQLISIERADWPNIHDIFKAACDCKAWQR